MLPKHPLELLDYLSFYVSVGYHNFKLSEGIFYPSTDTLDVVFLVNNGEEGLEGLKPRLEGDFSRLTIDALGKSIKILYSYNEPYIDEKMLELETFALLRGSFPALAMSLVDDDVTILRTDDSFVISLGLPAQAIEYFNNHKSKKDFITRLNAHHFYKFEFKLHEKDMKEEACDIEQFEKFLTESASSEERVNKTKKIGKVEYYLGKVIVGRPIHIKYLRLNVEDQVIAGRIMFLTKRDFLRKGKDGTDEKREYYTFVLDDGSDRVNCVFFPTQKTGPSFDKLVNDTYVALIGTQTERNGRESFRVSGVSFAEEER